MIANRTPGNRGSLGTEQKLEMNHHFVLHFEGNFAMKLALWQRSSGLEMFFYQIPMHAVNNGTCYLLCECKDVAFTNSKKL